MPMTNEQRLEKIAELCKPGQELNLRAAIDIICEVWNLAIGAPVEQEEEAE